ncbi:MAG: hypothetical protein H6624_02930 [Bdellovibrionaceae bacterium]|nr:hypothetical protein [Bdellovibrionales bacterium]MCB9083267.1 hypothetical protein [Pseudobdellovibrionaceae bacterium]
MSVSLAPVSYGAESKKRTTSAKKESATKTDSEGDKGSALPPEETDDSGSSLKDLFKSLDYPELQVVPRASQRLKMEAGEEDKNWWYIHWPFYLSALTTFAMGTTAEQSFRDDLTSIEREDARSGALVARTIGAAWFFGTMLIASRKPYQKAWAKVRGFSGGGRSNELLRERLAEESLEKPAHTMKVLSYVSTFTNLAAAGYVGSFLDDQGKVFAAIGGALAFLPMIFDDWYVYNFNKHLEYKRNIFSPVVSMAAVNKPTGGTDLYPSFTWVVEY